MTESTSANKLRDKYSPENIPRLGTASQAGSDEQKVQPQEGDGVMITAGDAIIRESEVGAEVRVVLETNEHGFVTWVCQEERYSYLPIEHIEEDIQFETYDVEVRGNPWGLA